MVKKEIPDAEEFVFTGNFKCVSMSREVMRTAAHTNSNHTHTHTQPPFTSSDTHGSGFPWVLRLRVFFIFGRNQYIWFGLNDGGVIHKP